ncbi:MAG: 50S ribosomal protein L25/general stress protein Ctc [Desulfobacterales bacterium]
MEQFDLNTTVRKTVGNGPARALRRTGHIPAVLYGPKITPVLLSVNGKELEQILKKGGLGQIILNLLIQNGEKAAKTAMIKELQIHPVSGNLIHVDFYEIDMDRKIKVMVPVVTKGISKGVELGGLLQIVRRELEVLCLPDDIPSAFEIDITDLDIGESVHSEELELGENVEFPADANFTVVTVLSPKVEVLAEEEEEEEEVEEAEGEEEGAPEAAKSAEEE